MRSFYFAGSLSPLQGHCTPLQLCDLLDEGDRAVEECLEWGSSSNLKLPRAHWQKQRRGRKKRTKELDFLSPAVFDGHKASPFWLPSFFCTFSLERFSGNTWSSCFLLPWPQLQACLSYLIVLPSLIWVQRIGGGAGIQDQPEDLDRYTNLLWEPPR